MKYLFFLAALFFCSLNGKAQTQLEMNEAAHNSYFKADKELNDVYHKILKEYKADTAFIKNFKAAQRLWVQFRDAEVKAKYPDREDGYYGSMHPMCWYGYLEELTVERIKKFRVWLTGVDGDACSGSIKDK